MADPIWPAVSAAVARQRQIDTIANNLANINTDGFKKDAPTFKEYLANVERVKDNADIPRGPITDKDLYPLDGRDQSFVVVNGTYSDFKQGSLKVTHAPLDVALNGPGFLEVSTPEGIRHTRQGRLKLTKDGLLVTSSGYPVLATQPGGLASAQQPTVVQPGQGGLPPTQGGVGVEQQPSPQLLARFINLRDRGPNISISESGEIFADGNRVATLAVREFVDPKFLRKEQDLMFRNEDPNNILLGELNTQVHQGMIETSNVNPVKEMADMIRAQREFETDLKALETYDALMGKSANELGRL